MSPTSCKPSSPPCRCRDWRKGTLRFRLPTFSNTTCPPPHKIVSRPYASVCVGSIRQKALELFEAIFAPGATWPITAHDTSSSLNVVAALPLPPQTAPQPSAAAAAAAVDVVDGLLRSIKGEKDPRCLLVALRVLTKVGLGAPSFVPKLKHPECPSHLVPVQ